MMTYLMLLAGLVLLTLGGDWLVAGAARLASRFGISTLVVGLTVVAFGTSAPELMVTLNAAFTGGGAADLALGNVVGSNLFNILLILGVCALLRPLLVAPGLLRRDLPWMVVACGLLVWCMQDGNVSTLEGAVLSGLLLVYISQTLWQARRDSAASTATDSTDDSPSGPLAGELLRIVGGLALLVLGAHWLVAAAVALAQQWGLSETVIGLTIVAGGTSLPEVAASVMATLRNQRDMAVGNIVGSCLFNVFAVAGLGALVAPGGLVAPASLVAVDSWVMLAVAVVCLPVCFTGRRIDRWEGALFFGYYLAYLAYLILDATGHPARDALAAVMLTYVVPATLLLLALSVLLSARRTQPVMP